MENSKKNQELHDRAVQKIAEWLFSFPGSEFTPGSFHPTWVTYTNVPKQLMPIPMSLGAITVGRFTMGELYPDIVIVDSTRGNMPMVIAEVETKDTLTYEKAFTLKWKPDMDECARLYVFVPEGCGRDAAIMILDYKVRFPTALYTYGFDDAGNLRLTPV